jgi:hypothetical protein
MTALQDWLSKPFFLFSDWGQSLDTTGRQIVARWQLELLAVANGSELTFARESLRFWVLMQSQRGGLSPLLPAWGCGKITKIV